MKDNNVQSLLKNSYYRVLGLWSNGSFKEQTANLSRIKAYSKVGRTASFKTDLTKILGTVDRSEENITRAEAGIHLDEGRFTAALFWFINADKVDALALEYLTNPEGNIEDNQQKAKSLWLKTHKVSTFINLAALSLLENRIEDALYWYNSAADRIETEADYFCDLLGIKNHNFVSREFLLNTVLTHLAEHCNIKDLEKICMTKNINTDFFSSQREKNSSKVLGILDELERKLIFNPAEQSNPISYLHDQINGFSISADEYLSIDGNSKSDEVFILNIKKYFNFVKNYFIYALRNISDCIEEKYLLLTTIKKFKTYISDQQLNNSCDEMLAIMDYFDRLNIISDELNKYNNLDEIEAANNCRSLYENNLAMFDLIRTSCPGFYPVVIDVLLPKYLAYTLQEFALLVNSLKEKRITDISSASNASKLIETINTNCNILNKLNLNKYNQVCYREVSDTVTSLKEETNKLSTIVDTIYRNIRTKKERQEILFGFFKFIKNTIIPLIGIVVLLFPFIYSSIKIIKAILKAILF